MAYIKSNLIEVFPSTKRGHHQRSARLMSEASLTRIPSSLLDKKSFVITDTYNASLPFEFMLNGYYFIIDKGSTLRTAMNNATNIYASIKIDDNTTGYKELSGQDEAAGAEYQYKGVEFTTTQPASADNIFSLQLLNGTTIPKNSKLKYAAMRVEGLEEALAVIDGGVIT